MVWAPNDFVGLLWRIANVVFVVVAAVSVVSRGGSKEITDK